MSEGAGPDFPQAGVPGARPVITSIIRDFTAEALEQLRFWLEQNPPSIPISQIIGYQTSIFPPGFEALWPGATPPAGWLVEDGSAVDRTQYAALFTAITFLQTCATTSGTPNVTVQSSTDMHVGMALEGTGIPAGATVATITDATHITISANATATGSPSLRFFPWGNGNGTTTFNVPDSRDTFPIGASATKQVGSSGGEATHVLTVGEMPAHVHTVPGSGGAGTFITGGADGNAPTYRDTSSVGGGSAHNNMPPWKARKIIIKT